jgi:hypothetical protein
MRPGKGSPWARQEVRPLRLDDIAERLGDRMDAIRASLDGQEDVAVVDARDTRGDADALLVATRRGILVTYPWSGAPGTMLMPPGWVAWGDVRASTVQTIASVGVTSQTSTSTSTSTAGPAGARHSCTILLRGVELTASGDGDEGRRAVDAFHDEVVRRGTPWHYPS